MKRSPAAVAPPTAATGTGTSRASVAVINADRTLSGRDADNRVFRPEPEEPGLTLSDYVDVYLIAAESQLIESPSDCLVDRLSARLRYRHPYSSIRWGPRRGPPCAG